MKLADIEKGRDLFALDPEEEATLNKIAKPIGIDRPITEIDPDVEPGGPKTHKWFMNPRFHAGLAITGLSILGFFVYWLIGGMNQKTQAANVDREKEALEQEVRKYRSRDADSRRENLNLTQANQFSAVPLESDQKKGKPSAKNTTPASVPATPTLAPQRVRPQNTVRMPRRSTYTPRPVRPPARISAPPRSASVASKPPAPSISDCTEYVRTGVIVPACKVHRISLKQEPAQKPIDVGRQFKPAPASKPIKLTPYKPPTTAAARSTRKAPTKPSGPKINYLAGQIPTMEQYQQQHFGAGSSTRTPIGAKKIKAKVEDFVEWDSPQVAQQMVIPLTITEGPQKGLPAEAKIVQLNGVQFRAEVVSINGEPVEPGTMELRKGNTAYLRADIKRRGGVSFKDRLVSTGLAIAGEAASDQLVNVRGGNHVSNLVSQNRNGGQPITQTWRFSGNVVIVRK